MIYLELFLGFLKVGFFSFGGGYAAISLIRDVVMDYGWIDEEMLAYMIAVSESTPGPIMVNLATYVGSNQAGFLGALIATASVIMPSFVMILMIMALLKSVLKNRYVQAVLGGLKPCVTGIVLATGMFMLFGSLFGSISAIQINMQAMIIAGIVVVSMVGYRYAAKKKLSPIVLIVISAVAGIVVYGV